MDDDSFNQGVDSAQRRTALRSLAQASVAPVVTPTQREPTSAPLVTWSSGRRGVRRQRIISTLSVLAVVVVIGVVVANIVGAFRPATHLAAKSAIRINPTDDGLNCVTQIAWSPDGKLVAAQGNTANCGASASDSQTGVVYIYDANTGTLKTQLHADAAVFNAPAVQQYLRAHATPTSGSAPVYYFGMTWTGDSQAILALFSLEAPDASASNSSSGAVVNGLVRLSVKNTAASAVWLDTPTKSYRGNTLERWDLTTGASALIPAPAPATAYRWNADGTLSPDSASSNGPIGAPNAGSRFTIWQSGNLQYAEGPSGPNNTGSINTQDVGWNTDLSPISPDGRYFYGYIPAYGSLVPPSIKLAFPHELHVEPRDKALLTLAQQMTQAEPPAKNVLIPRMLVTWRPDGRYLAALTANTTAPAPATAFTVSIYDTTTGKLVKRLTPNFSGLQAGPAGVETLAWSPDGVRLLLSDNIYGAITIWGPGELPA